MYLKDQQIALIVDRRGVIFNEYLEHVEPIIRGISDEGHERFILSYWFLRAPRRTVDVSNQDPLMVEIDKIIRGGGQREDRVFVFVAFKEGRLLISNDKQHIVCGSDHEKRNPRRIRLLRSTRKLHQRGAAILKSCEAHAKIPT